jgi:hypothetical protein
MSALDAKYVAFTRLAGVAVRCRQHRRRYHQRPS